MLFGLNLLLKMFPRTHRESRYTVVVPLSYDLATHLGQGSAFSGLMVSAPFAVYLAGLEGL